MVQVGRVSQIVRYPIKSMAGTITASAYLGWHGLEGDRRFAFRRLGEDGGFPWLSASRLPELILYQPVGFEENSGEPLPTHVQTPTGSRLEIGSAELLNELSERFGSALELMKLKHGIFDEATVSVISEATIAGIGREAEIDLDPRRFRTNILLQTDRLDPFLEDEWVGRTLIFGESDDGPSVNVTMRDERCVMINLDPATGEKDSRIMKTVVHLNDNNAGVYATVLRRGTIRVGDRVNVT